MRDDQRFLNGSYAELSMSFVHDVEFCFERRQICGNLAVREDDVIRFEHPNPEILKTIASFGFVSGSSFAPATTIEGQSIEKASLGKEAT